MRKINWGIIGTGSIANKFATALNSVNNAQLYAVASRTLEKAEEFKTKFNGTKAYGSYEELVSDPNVDVVYIATPHVFHKENAILCINHHKAVLCEKPFSLNSRDAKEVYELAKTKNVFIMEAMWTRFLPITRKVLELVNKGEIGEIKRVTADFSFRMGDNPKHRLLDLNLGGGALLDVGIYPLTYAIMFLGYPKEINSLVHIGETGVDEQSVVIMKNQKSQFAILTSAVQTDALKDANIYGTNGRIHIPTFWNAQVAYLYDNDQLKETINLPFNKNGYEYEIEEVNNCLINGKLESDIVPMSNTIKILELMDNLRKTWNFKYPME